MHSYKALFLDGQNNPIKDIVVQADSLQEALREAQLEYNRRGWRFEYWDLAVEVL